MPLLLDLSAAFDTFDHPILLNSLSNSFGVGGSPILWFSDYLIGRSQCVSVWRAMSAKPPPPIWCASRIGAGFTPVLGLCQSPVEWDGSGKQQLEVQQFSDDTHASVSFQIRELNRFPGGSFQPMQTAVWIRFRFTLLTFRSGLVCPLNRTDQTGKPRFEHKF